nr:Gfo/Idh/MocA family oxidoreductase [Desulfobulbaceae bacterium]
MIKSRIGVIGVGYLGLHHARKYAAMENVDLVGVADIDISRAKEIAHQLNTRSFGDFKELLPLVDAVSIVVPTKKHFEVANACLDYGVDVLIEKPITVTIDEADALISKAELCKRVLQVGHIEQFNPAVLAMEQYITSPIFIESQRIHSFNPRGADVDVVLDLMIHDIDIITSIVPSPIKTIHAVGVPVITNSSDIANVRMIFENGCTANITVSRISKTNIRKIRIFQPRSFISVDYGKKEIYTIKHLDELNENGHPKEEFNHFCFAETDALETELKAFILNIQHRTAPKIGGREGRKALKIAHQIIDQMKNYIIEHKELLEIDN